MPSTLDTHAVEESTYIITANFFDEDGVAVIPDAGLKWSLADRDGTVINSREDVVISVPAASVDIVLSGDDLALDDINDNLRILTIEGTYGDDDYPIKDEVRFYIDNLVKVT